MDIFDLYENAEVLWHMGADDEDVEEIVLACQGNEDGSACRVGSEASVVTEVVPDQD